MLGSHLPSSIHTLGEASNNSTSDSQDLFGLASVSFKLDFTYGEQIAFAIAVFLIGMGVLLLFFGTRLFKAALFVFALIGFGALSYFIVVLIWSDSRAGLITGAVVGLLMALLILKVWKLSLFSLGAGAGYTLWVTAKAVFPNLITSQYVDYGILGALALTLGVVALKLEKVWLLLGTPLIGALFISQGAGHFQHYVNVFSITALKEGCDEKTCYYVYASVLGLWVLGFLVQWRLTSHWAVERRRQRKRGKTPYHMRMDDLREERSKRKSKRSLRSHDDMDDDVLPPSRPGRVVSVSEEARGVRVVISP